MFKKLLSGILVTAGLLGIVYAANWPTTVSSDSNLYIAKNNCGTSLTSNITSAVTTIPASNTSCFATVGYITIGEEAILCTGKTGTTFTGCTRGSDGTTAVAHISGDEIGAFFVAAHHNKLKDELIAISTSFLQGAQFHTDFTNTRFGIGTASPGTVLQVNIPSSDNGILLTDGGSNYNSLFQMSRSGAVRLKMTTGSLIGNIYGSGGLNLGGALDTDHIQIDSAGKLGIGLAPSDKLDVSGNIRLSGGNKTILFSDAGNYDFSIVHNSGNSLDIRSPENVGTIVTFENGGNVGIGATPGGYKLNINGSTNLGANTDLYGDLYFKNDTKKIFSLDQTKSLQVANAGTIVTGSMGIGVTPGYQLDVKGAPDNDVLNLQATSAGTVGLRIAPVGASGNTGKIIGTLNGTDTDITIRTGGANNFIVKANGYIVSPGVYAQTTASAANVVVDSSGNLMRSTSARKYKKNITSITLDEAKKTLQVTPVKYQSKAPIDDPAEWHYGFVADDAGPIDPLLVTYDVKTSTTGVKSKIPENIQYERIVVPLLKLVQDLESRVATLEAKVDTLEKAGK